MELKECAVRRQEATRSFNEHEHRSDGAAVVHSLSDGLSSLRNLLFTRIHEDVESKIGVDSMLLPISPLKSEQAAKLEIELLSIAEAVVQVQARSYTADDAWFLTWLLELRLGEHSQNPQVRRRVDRYLAKNDDQRRLAFSAHLEKAYPEARRAPLILYRLFPLSVRVATALAFGAPLDANEIRNQQIRWLPAIRDCHECHGSPLENGETCRVCGNPIWSYRWLMIAD